MIVICKKPTKRLVKGVRYEIGCLWNSTQHKKGSVEILGIGTFTVNNFTDINGNPLPKIDIILPRTSRTVLEFSSLKEGDILVCTSDSYKTLGKGCMYQIEKLKETIHTRKNWNGTPINYTERIFLQGLVQIFLIL